jgi:hypothetical protein
MDDLDPIKVERGSRKSANSEMFDNQDSDKGTCLGIGLLPCLLKDQIFVLSCPKEAVLLVLDTSLLVPVHDAFTNNGHGNKQGQRRDSTGSRPAK